MIREYKFNYDGKTKPFPHQVEAIDFVQKNQFIALFDEQGLGKTKIVIESLCKNISEKKISGALIICKKNLIQTWYDEIETHSFLKSIILRGSPKEKGIRFMGFTHFYLINYESVIGEIERLKMFLKIRNMALVLDESHTIKNPESKTAQAIMQLKDLASKRIIISGTPIANRPEDLWSQFFFLDGGKLLGNNFAQFKATYSVNLRQSNSFINSKNILRLSELVRANSIRRKKNDVLELPDKIYSEVLVELKGRQLEMYEQLRDELFIEIENFEGDIVIDESNDLLKKLIRLEQISSNPKLIDNSYDEEPAKFPVLYELVKGILSKNEKVIIWSCFVDNIRYLNRVFGEFGSQMIYGDIPIDRRNVVVKRFRFDNDYKVLVANPAAAREGLTLTSANNAIYLDRNFNLIDYLQSQDRIHRISQDKECNIIKIIAQGTIDQYIDEILKRKSYLAGYIQGDNNKIDFSETLTKAEILKFIGRK